MISTWDCHIILSPYLSGRSYLPISMIGCPPSLPPYLPDSLKTEMERLEEEAMIGELVELVEKRDALLWALHLEKTL